LRVLLRVIPVVRVVTLGLSLRLSRIRVLLPRVLIRIWHRLSRLLDLWLLGLLWLWLLGLLWLWLLWLCGCLTLWASVSDKLIVVWSVRIRVLAWEVGSLVSYTAWLV
jgi:hypothetical protein